MSKFESIWRKPEERPEDGTDVMYSDDLMHFGVWQNWKSFDHLTEETKVWCYLSDFINLLPDWAKK